MSQLKFSIIVPAYNAEKFIGRCLDSLLQQDLMADEYEVIVVNDGSQDSTHGVLETYSEQHTQIHCYHTSNQGVSLARNYGIDHSSGEYLLFVDADDTICPNSLKKVYETASPHRLDLLVMDYQLWTDSGEINKTFDYAKRCKKDTTVQSGISFMRKCLPPIVWSIAYRTEYWKKNNFRFLPIRHEDEELIPRVFYFAEKVSFLPLDFYHYYQNQASFMMNYDEKAALYMIQAMESLNDFRKTSVIGVAMNSFFEEQIAKKLLQAFKDSIRSDCSIDVQKTLISVMKEKGMTPIPKSKKGLRSLMYKKSPRLFIAYYRLKYR